MQCLSVNGSMNHWGATLTGHLVALVRQTAKIAPESFFFFSFSGDYLAVLSQNIISLHVIFSACSAICLSADTFQGLYVRNSISASFPCKCT